MGSMSRHNRLILELIVDVFLLPVPLFFIFIILRNFYINPITSIIFASAFAFMFWFILEQVFLTKLKEYRRIISTAKHILKVHRQQHFKQALSRLCAH